MKILSQESNIGTASTVSSATAVRIYNSDSSAGIVTRTDSGDNTIGKLTVPAGEVLYLEKKSTDKLVAPSTVLASKVAYSHMMYYASYSSGGGSGYSDGEIVTSNLAYHLDANNSSSYGGSGSTWTDLVAGTNNATINGATYTQGSGDEGHYFDFDGTNDYVEIDSPIVSGDTFTIELWCRNDAATMPNDEYGFTTEGNAFSATNLVAYIGDRWQFQGNSFIMARTYTVHVPQGQEWNQVVAVVYKNNNSQVDIRAKIYLNGQLSNSISSLKNFGYSAGNGNILGRRSNSSTPSLQGYWDGQISILRYYNAALTDANILTNYNANKGRYGLS